MDRSDPVSTKPNGKLLFTVERIQAFIAEDKADEMLTMMTGGAS